MHILCTGLSFHTAPIETRERAVFSGDRLASALADAMTVPELEQIAILSTCNRTEIYTASAGDVVSAVRVWLLGQAGPEGEALRPHVYELRDLDAVVHLCRVAAGLDSQILAESEILGQVKAAARAARALRATGVVLDRMLATAIAAGKRARSETKVGRGAFSVGRCAVEIAKDKLGPLPGRAFLILGAGKIAEVAARHLRSHGAETILVANRTHSKAQELALALGGRALRYDQLVWGLTQADIVISSTSAPHFVLLPEHISEAMAARGHRPLFLVDVAVPRDIDPGVRAIPGVHLYDLDDLCGGLGRAAADRAGEVEAAERIVAEAASEFQAWLATRAAIPALGRLRLGFDQARRQELARLAPRMGRLSPADRAWVEQTLGSLTKRLLHEATVSLKLELAGGNGRSRERAGEASLCPAHQQTSEHPAAPDARAVLSTLPATLVAAPLPEAARPQAASADTASSRAHRPLSSDSTHVAQAARPRQEAGDEGMP